jgi:hypothetical protein
MTGRDYPVSAHSPAHDAASIAAINAALFHVNCSPVLGALIRHRVPDHLSEGPLDAGELARRAGLHPLSTIRALRLLTGFGIFKEVKPGTFENNAASSLLREGAGGMRNFAWWFTSPANWRSIGAVDHCLLTGESAWLKVLGESLWEYLRKHPEDHAAFNSMFGELRCTDHAVIAKAYDWNSVKRVVDIGGGNGSVLGTILTAHAHLQGTVFDQPEVMSAAAEYLAARGVSHRCEILAGSFFDPIPAKGDVWILSQILHDWDDADCRRILTRCREGMQREDRLLVVEMVTVPCRPNMQTALNDISMLVTFGEARQRTEDEYRHLFSACGFVFSRMISTTSRFSILEIHARD